MCSVTNHINALKGQKRHNTLYSNAFALSGRIALDGLTPTQGVAALCPGLCAFAPSGRTPFLAKVHKVSSLSCVSNPVLPNIGGKEKFP